MDAYVTRMKERGGYKELLAVKRKLKLGVWWNCKFNVL